MGSDGDEAVVGILASGDAKQRNRAPGSDARATAVSGAGGVDPATGTVGSSSGEAPVVEPMAARGIRR